MTREGFDGSAQERGLRELERRTGKRAKHLAAALDCDTQTWRRYFWGQQPLRSDMIPAVAAAYGVTTRELLEAVGLLNDDMAEEVAPDGWDLRTELAAILPDAGAVERTYSTLKDEPYFVQTAGLAGLRAAPMDWPPRPKRDVAYVYVAQRPDGNRWTARRIRDDWNELVARVKIGDQLVTRLTPHGGRRSFGTMHMVSGTPLADLSRLMGHANPAVTAASYLGTSRGRRQAAAEQLAALISPPGTPPKGQEEGHDAV